MIEVKPTIVETLSASTAVARDQCIAMALAREYMVPHSDSSSTAMQVGILVHRGIEKILQRPTTCAQPLSVITSTIREAADSLRFTHELAREGAIAAAVDEALDLFRHVKADRTTDPPTRELSEPRMLVSSLTATSSTGEEVILHVRWRPDWARFWHDTRVLRLTDFKRRLQENRAFAGAVYLTVAAATWGRVTRQIEYEELTHTGARSSRLMWSPELDVATRQRLADGAVTIAYLRTLGLDAEWPRSPGPHCGGCPMRPGCPAAQAQQSALLEDVPIAAVV